MPFDGVAAACTSAGMETLCGQAYGASNYKALGVVLQRALIITWLVCMPITLLWWHMEPVLLALGQQPKIAAGAAGWVSQAQPVASRDCWWPCRPRGGPLSAASQCLYHVSTPSCVQ